MKKPNGMKPKMMSTKEYEKSPMDKKMDKKMMEKMNKKRGSKAK